MFSKIIRLGVVITGAAILSSCGGGSGQTLTQQATPEGLFTGTNSVFVNPTGATTPSNSANGTSYPCTQNMLVFVEFTNVFYAFFSDINDSSKVISASTGSLANSGGPISSSGILEVTPPNVPVSATAPHGTNCGVPIVSTNDALGTGTPVNNEVTSPTFVGAYNTGINIAGTLNYPFAIDSATPPDFKTTTFTLNYNYGYQGVQSLATLAGTYVGTVGTSQLAEAATFTFGPASVPANSGNQFGVGIVTGTGASGCTYTGTVSPLFKGNGYNLQILSGGSPCLLANAQFTGLVYLDTSKNFLYSFAPNTARTDGLIFTGSRH